MLFNQRLVNFLLVGFVNFTITIVVFYVCNIFFYYLVSSTIAFLCSCTNSYFMNKKLVFKSSRGRLFSFVFANVPGLLANTIIMATLNQLNLDIILSQVLSIFIVMVVNYNVFKIYFRE
ncbi:GtrA family protein [Vibrio cyclitrophicus]